MSFTITGTLLKSISPSLNATYAVSLADSINRITPAYRMNSADILPAFLAQIVHESNEFKFKAELMSYSVEGLIKTWPSRFKTKDDAAPFARNPRALANKVYNGRMGNKIGTDDGWNFRGSGFMQMTGKDNAEAYMHYKKAGKGYPLPESPDTAEEMLELVRTNDDWAIDNACWVFAVCKNCIPKATSKDFIGITKLINGGKIGLDSRERYYKKALEVIA